MECKTDCPCNVNSKCTWTANYETCKGKTTKETDITKGGNVKIGSSLYYVRSDNYAETRQSRYGQGTIRIIE